MLFSPRLTIEVFFNFTLYSCSLVSLDQSSTTKAGHSNAMQFILPAPYPIEQLSRTLYTFTSGPALMTSSVASDWYFLKFSTNRPPSLVTSSLKLSCPWLHAFLGFSSSDGTPVQDLGTARLNVSYVSNSTLASSPEWIASRMARVYFNLSTC